MTEKTTPKLLNYHKKGNTTLTGKLIADAKEETIKNTIFIKNEKRLSDVGKSRISQIKNTIYALLVCTGMAVLPQESKAQGVEIPEIPIISVPTEQRDNLQVELNTSTTNYASVTEINRLDSILFDENIIPPEMTGKYIDIIISIYDILGSSKSDIYQKESQAYMNYDEIKYIIDMIYKKIAMAESKDEKIKIFDTYMLFLQEFVTKIEHGEKIGEDDCTVYPNPLNPYQPFSVEFPGNYTTIQIFDISGKKIDDISMDIENIPLYLEGKSHIEIAGKPAGTYLIKFIAPASNKKYAPASHTPKVLTKKIIVK